MIYIVTFMMDLCVLCIGHRMGASKINHACFQKLLKLPNSLGLGEIQQLLKTRVITCNFTRIHCDYLLIT